MMILSCIYKIEKVSADFLNVIKQLQLMEIISCPQNNIIVTSDELNGENNVGLENGFLQFLLPVYIRNDAIWTFACWGNFHQWESMVNL
ncbi:hypothetical protein KHA80_19005 [Anaerobacillus sp. HL2]|nr:hypothetical protein KHA80_19005 [Anaerobacillus sp. HL2]